MRKEFILEIEIDEDSENVTLADVQRYMGDLSDDFDLKSFNVKEGKKEDVSDLIKKKEAELEELRKRR